MGMFKQYTDQGALEKLWFEDWNFCVCGCPEDTLCFIYEIMQLKDDHHNDRLSFDEYWAKFQELTKADHEGLRWFIWYWLDAHELTEHGGNVSAGWLTPKGEEVLALLQKWWEEAKGTFEDVKEDDK